jgi:hypothetical protein
MKGGHLHLALALKTSGVTPPFTLTPGCSDAELEREITVSFTFYTPSSLLLPVSEHSVLLSPLLVILRLLWRRPVANAD